MYEELKNFLKGKDQNFEKELQVIQNSDINHINEYGILTPDENSMITSNLGGGTSKLFARKEPSI
jgi:hypothetical protein